MVLANHLPLLFPFALIYFCVLWTLLMLCLYTSVLGRAKTSSPFCDFTSKIYLSLYLCPHMNGSATPPPCECLISHLSVSGVLPALEYHSLSHLESQV